MEITIYEIGNRKICLDNVVLVSQKGHLIDIVDADGFKVTEIESQIEKIELDGFEPYSSGNESTRFDKFLCQRIDDIENAAFELTKKLLKKPDLEWDAFYIGTISEMAEHFLFEGGDEPCYPSFVSDQFPCYLMGSDSCTNCKFKNPPKESWNYVLDGTEESFARNLFNTLCCKNVDVTPEGVKIFLSKAKSFLKEGK